jgi:hypothetical protein
MRASGSGGSIAWTVWKRSGNCPVLASCSSSASVMSWRMCIVDVRAQHALFEIIEDRDPGRAAEAAKGALVELGPEAGARADGEHADALAAVAESEDEEPRAPVLPRGGVADHRLGAVVDPPLLARARSGWWGGPRARPDRGGGARSAGRLRSRRRSRGRRRGPARSPSRCGPGRGRPRSARGRARRRWPWDCARAAAARSRSTPPAPWPVLPPRRRPSRSTSPVDWPVLAADLGAAAAGPARPPSASTRSPSHGGRRWPLQCGEATTPGAPARSPAVVSRHSRRWPSRRWARSPSPASTSRRPAPRWPVFR